MRAYIAKLHQELGTTTLYVTHDQTEAMELAHRVAVLRSGRIMALGTPKDVYRHPPSEYVATFIGVANVWSGSISGEDSGILQVSTPLGTIEAPARQTGGCPPRGSSVKVIARPEALRLTIDKPANGNAVEVAVEAALFSGTHTEVVVTRGEQRIRVWVQGDEAIESAPAGRPLWLTIPSDDVSICPAEG
jgi:iron(III) transport system ATP-binding protein